jgi:protein Tex
MTSKQLQIIAQTLNISQNQVKSTAQLLTEGATVPFVARYRKEVTGSLDEVQILDIKKSLEKFIEADKRREAIIKSIEEQGKMTPELNQKLQNAMFLAELEDLYLPYKQKRKTRASIAIELGLEPLAQLLFKQSEKPIEPLAAKFLTDKVHNIEEALAGARDIIAEWINEDLEARNKVRAIFQRESVVECKVKKGKEKEGEKFKDYFEHNESLKNMPSHRFLAIKRGEDEGFLQVKIDIDTDRAYDSLERIYLKGFNEPKEQVGLAIKDCLKRLLIPSVEKEFNNSAKEKADLAAIEIFSTNLRQLLLASPLGQKRILALDPGFRTGCKTVVLDETGTLLKDTVVYPTFKVQEAEATIRQLLEKYKIEAVAIGNGTASRETESFIKSTIGSMPEYKSIPVFVVSEQGASIYSASEVAREEFPDKDITVRGAVSIGRRLMDPLAELVKLDPKSIGVGQYQHDVDQKLLKETLDATVELCVNSVGVEINTSSKHLLSYVSGIGPSIAANIVAYRNQNGKIKTRNELKKIPRLGDKAFEQAAGFLRIRGAKNPLDNTAVHPESYEIVELMAKDLGVSLAELIDKKELRKSINIQKYVTAKVGIPTLKDILEELEKPGRDPRETIEQFEFGNVNSIEDLREGMELPGIVTNITAFGCFVDIGVHQDGLVHVSQLANKFVKDPNEIVKVHQKVKVRVVEIESSRKRIALSMKF